MIRNDTSCFHQLKKRQNREDEANTLQANCIGRRQEIKYRIGRVNGVKFKLSRRIQCQWIHIEKHLKCQESDDEMGHCADWIKLSASFSVRSCTVASRLDSGRSYSACSHTSTTCVEVLFVVAGFVVIEIIALPQLS